MEFASIHPLNFPLVLLSTTLPEIATRTISPNPQNSYNDCSWRKASKSSAVNQDHIPELRRGRVSKQLGFPNRLVDSGVGRSISEVFWLFGCVHFHSTSLSTKLFVYFLAYLPPYSSPIRQSPFANTRACLSSTRELWSPSYFRSSVQTSFAPRYPAPTANLQYPATHRISPPLHLKDLDRHVKPRGAPCPVGAYTFAALYLATRALRDSSQLLQEEGYR